MYDPASLIPGDVLLLTRNPRESIPAQVLDELIALSEGDPMVHALIVGDGHLVDPLWHVTRHPLSLYAANGWRFTVAGTDAQRKQAVAWAEARVGQGYGLAELLEDGARLDLHIMAPSWYTIRRRKYTCSGFVAAAYASAGVRLTHAPAPSPADLAYSPLLIGRRPWEPPSGGSRALLGNPHEEA